MTLYIIAAMAVAALWDIGRRFTNDRAYESAVSEVTDALVLEVAELTAKLEPALTDIHNLKAVTGAQGQTLAKHSSQLTREALEKTQPLARIKR